jgi:hypothetical protein
MLRSAALAFALTPLAACSAPQDAPDDAGVTDPGFAVADCGTATEAAAAVVDVTRLGAVPVVFGSGVRGNVVLPGVVFAAAGPDAQVDFANACTRCTSAFGAGAFDSGSAVSGFGPRHLIDLEGANAWVAARVAEARDGAKTYGAETFLLAPMWTMYPFVRATDVDEAAANDSFVFSVSAAFWVGASVALVPGNACAADELRRIGKAAVDDDTRFTAMGQVLTASGGGVRVSIISTADEDVLDVDGLGCTTSTPGVCVDALAALHALQPQAPTDDDADVVMSGADPTWRAATFLAQPVSSLSD